MFKKLLNVLKVGCLATIGGLLGAFAGAAQTSKSWRRLGIPLLVTLYALFTLGSGWTLLIMSMAAGLSLGYGIPSYTDPRGSKIGIFFFNLFNGNHLLADIFTRGTVCLVIMLSLLVVPILIGNWLTYGLVVLTNLIIYTTLSWRGLGMFKFKGKLLLVSEMVTYTVLTGSAKILIG